MSIRVIKCTRWSELGMALNFHAALCDKLQSPAEFRLLNGADPVMVGLEYEEEGESLAFAHEVFAESPGGQTPLCQQIRMVVNCLMQLKDALNAINAKASLIIATDGEATDGNLADAMRPLKNVRTF